MRGSIRSEESVNFTLFRHIYLQSDDFSATA
jgi:hypothetical protein